MQNYQSPKRPAFVPRKPTSQPVNVGNLIGVLVGILLMLLGVLGLCYCVFLYFHQ
ncbi:hypothetical protein [Dictyobacter kobayashii]|uniref:Uncharacterized protein n=1 Tax=Dictyobacter kobayashii TaxID=2014872 RepID=A0A402AF55_9CHLR|nr:hypothetical protein [Dictyobacter kobayashii]GCE17703.1 hypothetical protein KDK_15030 [Dictyobacter kobayashii]